MDIDRPPPHDPYTAERLRRETEPTTLERDERIGYRRNPPRDYKPTHCGNCMKPLANHQPCLRMTNDE